MSRMSSRMSLALVVAAGTTCALVALAPLARADDPGADGKRAFMDVAKVLHSPRCVNCHPNGDRPHVGDAGAVHAMEVKRGLEKVGMGCNTCHRETATAASRAPGAPPAVKGWGLPPAEHPMVFEGKSPRALCEQLKDPAQNGGKDAAALAHHVKGDALVLYGWDPGGNRTLPPLTHAQFVDRFDAWIAAGMPCP
jgi:hypothetical protein